MEVKYRLDDEGKGPLCAEYVQNQLGPKKKKTYIKITKSLVKVLIFVYLAVDELFDCWPEDGLLAGPPPPPPPPAAPP